MNGWKIQETAIPGRLAKLQVSQYRVVKTSNDLHLNSQVADVWFERVQDKWKVCSSREPRLTGPISRILTYGSPLTIVIPALGVSHSRLADQYDTASTAARYLRLTNRLAFNLSTYLGLDSNIVTDEEALSAQPADNGRGVIVFGCPVVNRYATVALRSSFPIHFNCRNERMESFRINHRTFDEKGTALLFMDQKHLYICAFDANGYERALRAFPLRTGTPNPEWIVIGKDADFLSTGGILGAGFWSRTGEYNDAMSWLA
ncbi:uncharacterized protein EI90DRAFT_1618667 [Cantharellus anzutake]|uniref:uncharacterized protein n=1 Tax=Cantharellus anzutake TaxID=1750568 RepID=UPI0019079265|nr:uncharacterized protein EI90DRAFT_1618667 [Cantharellus anzutake]KAF8328234.1 hypothetical protein EI90DRAFT_1618667 [Cantharellus anzutake]